MQSISKLLLVTAAGCTLAIVGCGTPNQPDKPLSEAKRAFETHDFDLPHSSANAASRIQLEQANTISNRRVTFVVKGDWDNPNADDQRTIRIDPRFRR